VPTKSLVYKPFILLGQPASHAGKAAIWVSDIGTLFLASKQIEAFTPKSLSMLDFH